MSTSTPTLHALFVGINDYNPAIRVDNIARFPALHGCVSDVTALRNWLEQDGSFNLQSLTLLDKDATKANTVKAFEQHLGQAKKDDIVLFCYSGHGTVEKADTSVWTAEDDGRLEGLVCYYTEGLSSKFLLADKELRYLLANLYRKTKAHIVTIFDCCHSGDNTRAAMGAPVVRKQAEFRGGFVTFPQRPWEDFIFSKEFKPADFKGKGIDDVMPPGRYVQIAASESNESALESGGQGVLTAFLLESLQQTGGNLTYRDLMSRIRNQTRYRFDQRPRLYTPNDADQLRDMGFLKKPAGATATSATLIYNPAGEYRLDRGILHRVEPGVTTVTAKGKDGQPVTGRVESAMPDSSVVKFTNEALQNLSRDTQPATMANLSGRVVRVQLVNKDLEDKQLLPLLKHLNDPQNAAYFAFEDKPTKDDFSLVLWRGMAYFTRAGDLFRPLAFPIKTSTKGAAEQIARQLRHISQWKFAESLQNKSASALPENLLKVELFEVEADGVTEKPLAVKNGVVRLKRSLRPNQKWTAGLKVKITNQSGQDLYVAAPFCSYDFSCNTTSLLDPAVSPIESGKSKWLRDHKTSIINFGLEDSIRMFNWPESTETLKLLFSTEQFEVAALQLSALPSPVLLDPNRSKDAKRSSLDGDDEEEKRAKLEGWNTLDFKIIVENPLFNRVSKAELESVITGKNADLAHFMLGLYFENDGAVNGQLTLKKGVLEGEKGLWWDTLLTGANKWSRFWRNRDYKKAAEKFPNRPKIVSEGDSWFQHPTITEIIDHVARFYPVHCLAAAGDTIRNWSREGEVVVAMQEYQPAILLLSGGGNDILGESMLKFLADTFDEAEEGQQPERFFSPVFLPELDALTENYRTLFSYFKTNYPKMPVVVHGYDYPRPLPSDSKKTSWLGKYFNEKNILRPKDRTAAVRYMMDEFNKRLKAVADTFPGQVHYLDLRGIARDDQWADEIHPNDDGFQDISLKFIQKINELMPPLPTA